MRICACFLALALALAGPQPTASGPSANPGLVLRFDVDLVQVDVVVTDSHGVRVSGLQAGDFEVLQDGKPQKIIHFSYSDARPHDAVSDTPPVAGLPLTRDELRRTFVLMLDDANMAFEDFRHVQKALLRFVDEGMKAGDMAAVVRTRSGSGASQVFTFDRQWLHGMIEHMIWRPPLAGGTLASPLPYALRAAVQAMASFPGRKSVLLISPGFPSSNYSFARSIADYANRSSVTIETIDARGLPTLAAAATTHLGDDASAGFDMPLEDPNLGFPDPAAGVHRISAYLRSQGMLANLANMTAGRFLHDNNNIFGEVKAAADDSEGYYLIGWYPGPDAFAHRPHETMQYHPIRIRLRDRKGAAVRTRDGFFSWPGSVQKEAYSAASQVRRALFSPFRSGGIDVRLTASVGYDDTAGAYIDSLLHILPKGVAFHDAPDQMDCKLIDLEFLSTPMPLDLSKEPIEKIESHRPVVRLCGKALESVMNQGLVVTVRDPIAAPGPYQMRVAVRNLSTGDGAAVGQQGLVQRDSTTPNQTVIGSASQIIDVPNLKKEDFALTGITLWGGAGEKALPAPGAAYRLLTAGDPAVRQFHAGETVKYLFRVVRGPRKPAEAVGLLIKVAHEGKDVFASEPRQVQTGETVEGWYKLDSSLEPGQYLLGFQARVPAPKSTPITEWIDFEIAK